MDLSRRGFLGGLLASAAAAVLKVPLQTARPAPYVFTVLRLGGEEVLRVELSDDEVRYLQRPELVFGPGAPENVLHLREALLVTLVVHGGVAMHVRRGDVKLYGRTFECGFQELPKPGRTEGRMDTERWRELVGDVNDATRIQ